MYKYFSDDDRAVRPIIKLLFSFLNRNVTISEKYGSLQLLRMDGSAGQIK